MATAKEIFKSTLKGTLSGLKTGSPILSTLSGIKGGIQSAMAKPTTPVTSPVSSVGQSTQNQSRNITPSSNIGATSTTPTIITPPKTQSSLPPAGQQYASNLMSGNNNPISTTPTVTPTVPTAPTPTAPTVTPPSQKDNYINAYKKYVDSLKESADITEAKRVYNDYVANQAKSISGKEGQGRGIPLSIVRGEQEKLLKQTQPEATRLQNEVGILQDAQKATIDSLKAGVDMEGKLLEQDKPIEVGGILYQPQADGSYKQVAGISKASEGFTLGKDQVRYDAEGNIIAGGMSTSSTGDANVDAWVKGIQSGVYKPSDVPDELKDAVAGAMSSTEKPQSEISKQVVSVVDELLNSNGLDLISGVLQGGLRIGNLDPRPEAQLARNKYNQLKGLLSLENIKYLKGTGAISDAEQRLLANAASAIGRNLSDADMRNELMKLRDGLSAVKDNQLAPDEEEFLRSQGYTPEEINGIKSSFKSVGKTSASAGNLPQRNLNPGNVKKGGLADNLAVGVDSQGHLIFPDEQTGFRAMQLDLQAKINGQSKYLPPNPTIAQLGKVYAEDKSWSDKVAKILGVSPNTPTKQIPINNLVQAIARQEGYYA